MDYNKKKWGLDFILKNKAALILLVLGIIFSIASNKFLTSANLINVVRQVAVSGILAVGYTIIIACGCIDLSVGHMLSLVGVVTALLSLIPGMPLAGAILIGMCCGIFCGFFNATISTKFHWHLLLLLWQWDRFIVALHF